MSKQPNAPSKKRKADDKAPKTDNGNTKRLLMAAKSGDVPVTALSISQQTGLSVFLLGVVVDICENNATTLSSAALLDIVCHNRQIAVLNREALDQARPLYEKKKTTKTAPKAAATTSNSIKISDDEEEDEAEGAGDDDNEMDVVVVTPPKSAPPPSKKTATTKPASPTKGQSDDLLRKFIIDTRMHALKKTKVLLAGTTGQYESIPVEEQDRMMVEEFVGHAKTDRNYAVYVYYTGPTDKGPGEAEMRNPKNWTIVHKNHLMHFHQRFRGNLKEYLRHTSHNQFSSADPRAPNPLYDPRYIALKWLATKEGKSQKDLILSNRHLFRPDKDFLVKHYQKNDAGSALYYFDEEKELALLNNTNDDARTQAKLLPMPRPFDPDVDFKEQRARGFRVDEATVNHVTIMEYPPLCGLPIARHIEFTQEDFLTLGKRLYAGPKMAKPPGYYKLDPLLVYKANLYALNGDALAKRTSTTVQNDHDLILECDNEVPILEYMLNNKECCDAIRADQARYIYALMATELLTRDFVPPKKKKEKKSHKDKKKSSHKSEHKKKKCAKKLEY